MTKYIYSLRLVYIFYHAGEAPDEAITALIKASSVPKFQVLDAGRRRNAIYALVEFRPEIWPGKIAEELQQVLMEYLSDTLLRRYFVTTVARTFHADTYELIENYIAAAARYVALDYGPEGIDNENQPSNY